METKQVSQPNPKSASRLKLKRKAEFQIPTNLNEAATHYEKAQAVLKAQQGDKVEEETTYEVNPQINLHTKEFQQLLHTYTEALKAQNKMNLASGIQEGQSKLNHNNWILTLGNELLKRMLEREKEGILTYLREKLQLPELFLTIEVDEKQQNVQATRPYTNEEKLKEMAELNPSLKKLQKIFKTRIIY